MAQTSFFMVAAGLLIYFCWRTAVYLSYKFTLRRYGCQDPPRYHHKEPFMGLDYFLGFINAFKVGFLLQFSHELFEKLGNTYTVKSFGKKVFKTRDKEVSKAVHATYFENFGLQGLRYDTAVHLWGNGIIVVDGPHWKHGRALIKSSFDVVHLANMERLGKHTSTFLALLPEDDSTVDLAPLFKRLVRYKSAKAERS